MTSGPFYFFAFITILLAIQLPVTGSPPDDVALGAFSWLDPPQLQFSCATTGSSDEQRYAERLADTEAELADRLAAARALWRGRSRRHASDVLKFLAGPPPGGEAYRAFQREVETSIQPQAILRELREGDYLWGTWLAFLRPHKDLVGTLLAGLKDKPKWLPETMLALGNSGDSRALAPLLELLKSKDYRTAGDAAQALGYLGNPEAEPKLIEALAADSGWLKVNACRALARMGTRRALPALERVAKDGRYTGALNVKGMAEEAIKSLQRREKR